MKTTLLNTNNSTNDFEVIDLPPSGGSAIESNMLRANASIRDILTQMRRLVIFTSFVLAGVELLAQDSLHIVRVPNAFYTRAVLDHAQNEAILYDLLPVARYSIIEVGVSRLRRFTKKAQQATSDTRLGVRAYGLKRLSKGLFAGRMEYGKDFQKQIAWNLINHYHDYDNPTLISPHYNLAYEPGDWNNQQYRFDATVLFPLFSLPLQLGIAGRYATSQYHRTQNPLPRLTYLNMKAKFTLYYRMANRQTLGVYYRTGKLDNLIDVEYNGPHSDLNVPNNKSIYHRISLGYGVVEPALKNSASTKENTTTLGAMYIHHSSVNRWIVGGSYTSSLNKYQYQYAGKNFVDIADYNVQNYKMSIHKYSTRSLLMIKGHYTRGGNFREITRGRNYQATSVNTSIQYQKFYQNCTEIGGKLTFNRHRKQDYQAVNQLMYTHLVLGGFYANTLWQIDDDLHRIWIQSNFDLRFAIGDHAYFSHKSDFVNELAIPDQRLDTSHKYNLGASIGYQRPMNNLSMISLVFKVDAGRYFPIPDDQQSNLSDYAVSFALSISY